MSECRRQAAKNRQNTKTGGKGRNRIKVSVRDGGFDTALHFCCYANAAADGLFGWGFFA